MQKVSSSYRCVSLSLALGLALASLVLTVPCRLQSSSIKHIVTPVGSKIPTIFAGLKPYAREHLSRREGVPNTNHLWEERILDKRLGAHYRQACTQCTPGQCFGHYEIVVPCYGCCTNPTGCGQINNYQTNTSKGTYNDQVEDEPCGPDCCDAFFGC
jgi:hypothetical protein